MLGQMIQFLPAVKRSPISAKTVVLEHDNVRFYPVPQKDLTCSDSFGCKIVKPNGISTNSSRCLGWNCFHLFGKRVANVVRSCSDSTASAPPRSCRGAREGKGIFSICEARTRTLCSSPPLTSSVMQEPFFLTIANTERSYLRDSTPGRTTNSSFTANSQNPYGRRRLPRFWSMNWIGS